MITLVRTTLLLVRTHLGRVAFSKRAAFCLLAALGPAALAFLVVSLGDHHPDAIEVVAFPGWVLLLQVVVPITSLIAGSAVIAEEIDDRTITYLFTRPVPRAALLLGRWIATALLLTVLLGGGALLLYLVVEHFGEAAPGEIPIDGVVRPLVIASVLGGIVYSALFAAAGTFLKRPMIVGLGYTFVIEGFLANLPGKTQSLTIQYYLRSLVLDGGHEIWTEVSENMVGNAGNSLLSLGLILLASLVLGSWIVSRRQYLLTA